MLNNKIVSAAQRLIMAKMEETFLEGINKPTDVARNESPSAEQIIGDIRRAKELALQPQQVGIPTALSPKIYYSNAMVEQFRFPKSKRQRVRKKFSKNKANWRASKHVFVTADGSFFAHPSVNNP